VHLGYVSAVLAIPIRRSLGCLSMVPPEGVSWWADPFIGKPLLLFFLMHVFIIYLFDFIFSYLFMFSLSL
jgi:hypothetical protein